MESETFGICFSPDGAQIAASTYSDHGPTELVVLETQSAVPGPIVAQHAVRYPISKIAWREQQLIATASDRLRIYNRQLEELWCVSPQLTGAPADPPPLTSLDWNRINPQFILTSSVDTTCTLWDLSQQRPNAHTRLIAHDAEVLDVAFLAGSTSLFGSCSTDGSLRLFDLRNLNQSTIAYEQEHVPLLRLGICQANPNLISLVQAHSSNVVIVDLRRIGAPPLATLPNPAHAVAAVWRPNSQGLLSCAQNGVLSYFDSPAMLSVPLSVCFAGAGSNAGAWSDDGDMFVVATQQGPRCVQF